MLFRKFRSQFYLLFQVEVQSKKESKSTNINSQLQEIIFSLKSYLKKFLTEETHNDDREKVSLLLLQTIEQFTYKINFEDYNSEEVSISFMKIIFFVYINPFFH